MAKFSCFGRSILYVLIALMLLPLLLSAIEMWGDHRDAEGRTTRRNRSPRITSVNTPTTRAIHIQLFSKNSHAGSATLKGATLGRCYFQIIESLR